MVEKDALLSVKDIVSCTGISDGSVQTILKKRLDLRKLWGLTICLWLGLSWLNYWFSFTLAYSRISHEYLSLFIIVINLIFMFSL